MNGYFKAKKKQEQNKASVFIVFSILMLIFFTAGAYVLVNTEELFKPVNSPASIVYKETVPEYKSTKVIVPIKDIVQGQELKFELFKEIEKPSLGLPPEVVTSFEAIQGNFAKTLLLAEQPFTKAYLISSALASEISPKIPAGYRAITINVDSTTGVEGWALPDSIVDVLWTTTIRGEQSIVTIVENAKVLSAAGQIQKRDRDEPPPSTVTLLVTSKDAQKITLAQKTGGLSLALRGSDDEAASTGGGAISKSQLQGGDKAAQQEGSNVSGTLVMGGKKYLIKSNGELQPL